MATRAVAFCLEMLTFGHPESSGALSASGTQRAREHFLRPAGCGEGDWPLAQCLFAWKSLHLATQRELARFRNLPRRGDRLWPLVQCLFVWKCLHLATQRAPAAPGALLEFRTRGGIMATRAVAFCLEVLTFGHPESWGHFWVLQLGGTLKFRMRGG